MAKITSLSLPPPSGCILCLTLQGFINVTGFHWLVKHFNNFFIRQTFLWMISNQAGKIVLTASQFARWQSLNEIPAHFTRNLVNNLGKQLFLVS